MFAGRAGLVCRKEKPDVQSVPGKEMANILQQERGE